MPRVRVEDPWKWSSKEMTTEEIQKSFNNNLHYALAKDRYTTTSHDDFMALSLAIRDLVVERWIQTQQRYHNENKKRVYYLSMEFLIGRLLGNNIINLDLWKETKEALEDLGLDIGDIQNEEEDAGLGNGGLGRLAACFLDSMATLGIPAHGYGIRYDYGIFKQKIVNGYQVEAPDKWLKKGNPWEFQRPEYSERIKFYGRVHNHQDKHGNLRVEWKNTQDIIAMPYDIPVPGYRNGVVNTLRLWSARSSEEFDLQYFNDGDYENAVYNKMFSENISKVLYPNDATSFGRELRLKQEYFFTAASIADIIRRFKSENNDFKKLPEKAAIQLNDTHPALAVVELMRILIDIERIDWNTAWDIVVKTFAYTNHTIMPEAMECWTVPLLEKMLPRHMQIIYEINSRFIQEIEKKFPKDNHERIRKMSLIEEGNPKRIRMAHLAIVGSHSINGVSELHTTILIEKMFKDFYDLFPEKFNNKTNGITQRQWLLKANPSLSKLITESIGDKWKVNLYDLKKLLVFADDAGFRKEWEKSKKDNKKHLANEISKFLKIKIDPNSMFDVQVKRIHEYKRQLLFALYIISEYLKLKENPHSSIVPRTFIVAGKAAPGYAMAKLIIKFITSVASVINKDKSTKNKLKLVFLENYRVSLAEQIFPASDLSEQISTAGTEASGTGCMKFMANGALTVGTLDGANIEMADEVGYDNIFTFGLKIKEVQALRVSGYDPQKYIQNSPMLSEVIKLIETDFFSSKKPGLFSPLVGSLLGADPFLVCADFDEYCKIQNVISENYKNTEDWTRKAIVNVAKSGKFSSDRTISEYAKYIWDIPL